MLKVLVWIVSKDTCFFQNSLDILKKQHNGLLEVVDMMVGEDIIKVDQASYDTILVVGARQIGMGRITQAAHQLNLSEEKLLGDWIVCIPGFTLEKYRQLQSSCISIIAMNCFGGILLSTLGLPFRTPIINMYFSEQDYIRLLRFLRTYMEKKLLFKETKFETRLKTNYPLVTLGDVSIHMNHYKNFEEAVSEWNERKQRINWDNLFVTTYTSDKKILEQFDALSYGKKVCFVPFKSDLDSAWYINPNFRKDLNFWGIVNNSARGIPFFYDPFDMLLYGKKTPLIDM